MFLDHGFYGREIREERDARRGRDGVGGSTLHRERRS